MQPDDLQKLSRGELIELATSRGVRSADALTRAELIDEITKRAVSDDQPSGGMLGFLSVAGELVAGMVDRKLHMPEAAKLIREMAKPRRRSQPPPPLPTVTLAEIYAAQGYLEKALTVLDEVLAAEPEHSDARSLRERLAEELAAAEAAEAMSTEGAVPATTTDAPSDSGSETDGRTEAGAITAEADGQRDAALTADQDIEADAQVTQADSAVEGTDETSADASRNPFPARYDVDEIVALATDPRTVYVYWELRPVRFAQAHHVDPKGQLVLRALTVVSGALDIATDSRDIPVDQLVGDRFIRGLRPGAELRLCLGWNGPGGFVPLAVAEALQMPRDHEAPSRAVTADGHDGLTARRTPDEPAAGQRAADPRGGTASATASSRLRSYQAQLARQPSSGATGSSPSLAALDPGAAPVVVHFAKTRASASHGPLGGASDLMSTEGRSAALNNVLGGASDLYGGASDLFGGARDLLKNS